VVGLTEADVERARAGHRGADRRPALRAQGAARRRRRRRRPRHGQRGYHLLRYLAQTGTLCLGPMADGDQLFVLLD
jgi:hypothetical protein